MTFNDKLEQATKYLELMLKLHAPIDTGNLKTSGIRIAQVSPNNFQIIIGGEIAPYAVYTNAEWIAERWAGKRNPNQGWVNKTIELAKPYLIQILSGAVTLTELDKQLMELQGVLQVQFDTIADLVDRGEW